MLYLQNRMTHYWILHLSMCFAIYKLFGMGGLMYQLTNFILCSFWLDAVNFLEHYGLNRIKDENGIYESIGYQHSWSSVSSPVLFRLQRHSDHHAHSFRPMQILRKLSCAPMLPYEYILMLWIGLCPPLFKYIMNPRVQAIEDTKKGKYNPDRWNGLQPLSNDDWRRDKAAKIYFLFITIVFTYFVFYLY